MDNTDSTRALGNLPGMLAGAGIIYGNYLMFKRHSQALIWALCANTIWRRSGVTGGIVCLGFCAALPLICAMCTDELLQYAAQMNRTGILSKCLDPLLKWILLQGKTRGCTSSVDLLIKIESFLRDAVPRQAPGISIFFGASACLSAVEGPPLLWVTRFISTPAGPDIARLFDDLVRALIICSARHFITALCIGVIFRSPFAICGGVCAGFLSIFPFVPICAYCLPGSVLLWAQGRYTLSLGLLACGVLQGALLRKSCCVRGMSSSARILGTGAGMRAFGAAGAVLGPFLLGSILIVLRAPSPSNSPNPPGKPSDRANRAPPGEGRERKAPRAGVREMLRKA